MQKDQSGSKKRESKPLSKLRGLATYETEDTLGSSLPVLQNFLVELRCSANIHREYGV